MAGFRHRSHSKIKPVQIRRFSVVVVAVLVVVVVISLVRCSRRHQKSITSSMKIRCNTPVIAMNITTAAADDTVLNNNHFNNNLLVLVGTRRNLGLKNDPEKDKNDVSKVVLSKNIVTISYSYNHYRPIPISVYYNILMTAGDWSKTPIRQQLNLAEALLILSLFVSCVDVLLTCFSTKFIGLISEYLIGKAKTFCTNFQMANFKFSFNHNLLKFNYCDIRTLLMDRNSSCQNIIGIDLQF
jgi:hypothetical protein